MLPLPAPQQVTQELTTLLMLLEERAPAEAALAPAASRWPRPRPGGLQVKLAVLALLQAAGSVTGTALPSCPGHYCGRDTAEVGQWGAAAQCGACPRGSRTDGAVCVPCTAAVTPFSALYLAATMAVLIVWHAAFVLSRDDGHRPKLLVIGTVTLETVLAAVFAVLALAPAGELRLFGCPIQDLSDFYPYLHNPRIDCAATLHCASEAAFPLTTWVLVVNALCVPLAVLGRGVLMYTRPDVRGLALASLAATLYALPVHAFLHMVVGGLFYYSYPVLLFLVALVVAVRELANAAAEV